MDVTAKRLGVTSLIAQCSTCGWSDESEGTKRDDAKVRRYARAHVRNTGHTVTVQAVHATHYKARRR